MAFILTVTRITTVRRLPPVGLRATQPAWLIKHTKVLKKDEWAQRWLWGVVILSVSRTNLPLPRALFCPSAGGGQTQDGLSIHGGRGDRLWDDLQRLRVQLHTGLRGHTHDEVRVGFNCLQFYSLNVPFLNIISLQSTQALGGRRPWCGQSEESDLSAAGSWFAVPQFWVCGSRLLPWPGPRGGPALAILW